MHIFISFFIIITWRNYNYNIYSYYNYTGNARSPWRRMLYGVYIRSYGVSNPCSRAQRQRSHTSGLPGQGAEEAKFLFHGLHSNTLCAYFLYFMDQVTTWSASYISIGYAEHLTVMRFTIRGAKRCHTPCGKCWVWVTMHLWADIIVLVIGCCAALKLPRPSRF